MKINIHLWIEIFLFLSPVVWRDLEMGTSIKKSRSGKVRSQESYKTHIQKQVKFWKQERLHSFRLGESTLLFLVANALSAYLKFVYVCTWFCQYVVVGVFINRISISIVPPFAMFYTRGNWVRTGSAKQLWIDWMDNRFVKNMAIWEMASLSIQSNHRCFAVPTRT